MDASWILPVALLLAGIGLFAAAKRKKRPSAGAVGGWKINWSHGLPGAPTPKGSGWVIELRGGASLHYVQNYGMRVRAGQSLKVRMRITGIIASLEPGPATMSIILQRKGDNGREPGYRYFSFVDMPLTEGEHTLSVVVDDKHFGDVLKDTNVLPTVLAELESVGVMFGSGTNGRGHGVVGTNSAIVELVSIGA